MANLINLSQIKGGKALQQAIETIQKSYPADKVTTTISKKASTDTYTAQELLAEL